MANYVYTAPAGDGYLNLAMDGFFIENVQKDDIILYFFTNSNAVIIGRNQNAWRECDLANMERDGVQLVRRHTGGGAVYHDDGNLNFSFIMNEKNYDKQRQFSLLISAFKKLGLNVELSGRNDILLDGKKFSGNAYGFSGCNRAHHGTLLIDTDLSKLGDYLKVSKEKMQAKGVESVQARVCNLSEFVPDLTADTLRDLITESFIEEYGEAKPYSFSNAEIEELEKRRAEQASWEWRFGKTPRFAIEYEKRFSFGEMQFYMDLKDGMIEKIKIYSDCLDIDLGENIKALLKGCRFEPNSIKQKLEELPNKAAAEEIGDFFSSKLTKS